MKAIAVISCLFIAACASVDPVSPSRYYPAIPTAPLFDRSHGFQLSGNIGELGGSGAVYYSPTYNIEILANIGIVSSGTSDLTGSQYSFDVGGGVYDSILHHTVLEGLIGAGLGGANYNRSFDYGGGYQNVRFAQFWVQGDIGYVGKYGGFGLFVRGTHVNVYHDIDTGLATDLFFETHSYKEDRRENFWLVTPGLTVRLGIPQAMLQFTVAVPLVVGTPGTFTLTREIGIVVQF